MLFEERGHAADEGILTENARTGNAQMAARAYMIGLERAFKLLDLPEDPLAAGIVSDTRLSRCQLARGPIEQTDAEPLLELADRLACKRL